MKLHKYQGNLKWRVRRNFTQRWTIDLYQGRKLKATAYQHGDERWEFDNKFYTSPYYALLAMIAKVDESAKQLEDLEAERKEIEETIQEGLHSETSKGRRVPVG